MGFSFDALSIPYLLPPALTQLYLCSPTEEDIDRDLFHASILNRCPKLKVWGKREFSVRAHMGKLSLQSLSEMKDWVSLDISLEKGIDLLYVRMKFDAIVHGNKKLCHMTMTFGGTPSNADFWKHALEHGERATIELRQKTVYYRRENVERCAHCKPTTVTN